MRIIGWTGTENGFFSFEFIRKINFFFFLFYIKHRFLFSNSTMENFDELVDFVNNCVETSGKYVLFGASAYFIYKLIELKYESCKDNKQRNEITKEQADSIIANMLEGNQDKEKILASMDNSKENWDKSHEEYLAGKRNVETFQENWDKSHEEYLAGNKDPKTLSNMDKLIYKHKLFNEIKNIYDKEYNSEKLKSVIHRNIYKFMKPFTDLEINWDIFDSGSGLNIYNTHIIDLVTIEELQKFIKCLYILINKQTLYLNEEKIEAEQKAKLDYINIIQFCETLEGWKEN